MVAKVSQGDVTKTNPKNKEMETKMKRFMTKKFVTIGIVTGLVLGGAGAAIAFVTLTGSGSGTGSTTGGATTPQTITLSVHIASNPPILPGGSAVVTFDANNPAANNVEVTSISFGNVTSTDTACNNVIHNALISPFQFSMATVTENQIVPPATMNYVLNTPATLNWANELGQDQTPCLGKNLTLTVNTP